MKVIITGSDGFVASNLINKLKNDYIIGVDYLSSLKPYNATPNEFMNFDLSTGILPLDGSKIDLLIHLATVNQIAMEDNPDLYDVNIKATQNLCLWASTYRVPMIFSSSCSVYGDGSNLREDDKLNPTTHYASCKLKEEQIVKLFYDLYGLNTTILRFSNCYGDTTDISNKMYQGKKDVVRIFMENALDDEYLPLIYGMRRDYTYIDDVVNAIQSVIFPKGFNIYNIGTGVETSTENLAAMIIDLFDRELYVKHTPKRPTDTVKYRSMNCDKIKHLWQPKIQLREGLRKYLEILSR